MQLSLSTTLTPTLPSTPPLPAGDAATGASFAGVMLAQLLPVPAIDGGRQPVAGNGKDLPVAADPLPATSLGALPRPIVFNLPAPIALPVPAAGKPLVPLAENGPEPIAVLPLPVVPPLAALAPEEMPAPASDPKPEAAPVVLARPVTMLAPRPAKPDLRAPRPQREATAAVPRPADIAVETGTGEREVSEMRPLEVETDLAPVSEALAATLSVPLMLPIPVPTSADREPFGQEAEPGGGAIEPVLPGTSMIVEAPQASPSIELDASKTAPETLAREPVTRASTGPLVRQPLPPTPLPHVPLSQPMTVSAAVVPDRIVTAPADHATLPPRIAEPMRAVPVPTGPAEATRATPAPSDALPVIIVPAAAVADQNASGATAAVTIQFGASAPAGSAGQVPSAAPVAPVLRDVAVAPISTTLRPIWADAAPVQVPAVALAAATGVTQPVESAVALIAPEADQEDTDLPESEMTGDPTALADRNAPATPAGHSLTRSPDAPAREHGAALHRDAAWAERMMSRIEEARDAADSTDRRIRITPDALGAVDLRVRRDGEAVQIQLSAEDPATRAMLAEAAPRIAELSGRTLQSGGSPGGDPGTQHRPPAPRSEPLAARGARANPPETDTLTDTRLA